MDRIRKAVEDFKKENGNNDYPIKDLVIYAIKRLDNLPCEQHIRTIYFNKGTLVVLTTIVAALAVKSFWF